MIFVVQLSTFLTVHVLGSGILILRFSTMKAQDFTFTLLNPVPVKE